MREALSYAIDGESLIKDVMNGSVSPAEGVVPPRSAGAAKTGEYSYDPAKAKQMLAAARRARPQGEDHLGGRGVRRRHLG